MNQKQAALIVNMLHQALPYIKRFSQQYMVIKLGGNAITDMALLHTLAKDITLMHYIGMSPVLVHGGGPHINALLKQRDIKSTFKEGKRISNTAITAVVEEALNSVNDNISNCIHDVGGSAAAFANAKHSVVHAVPASNDEDNRLGRVTKIDIQSLKKSIAAGSIPVVSPIGQDKQGNPLNINADTVAGHIAVALKSSKLIMLTNVVGIKAHGTLVSTLNASGLQDLIDNGQINGGMLPKAHCALDALQGGIPQVHIIDGRVAHATLLEIFTDEGVGTLINA